MGRGCHSSGAWSGGVVLPTVTYSSCQVHRDGMRGSFSLQCRSPPSWLWPLRPDIRFRMSKLRSRAALLQQLPCEEYPCYAPHQEGILAEVARVVHGLFFPYCFGVTEAPVFFVRSERRAPNPINIEI